MSFLAARRRHPAAIFVVLLLALVFTGGAYAALAPKDAEAARAAMAKAAIADQTTQNDRIRWVQNDPRPKFQVNGHDAGLVIGGARRTDGPDLYWRIAQFLMPNHAYTPTAFPGEIYYGQTWVPVDDTSCWIYTYSWLPDRAFTDDDKVRLLGHGTGGLRAARSDRLLGAVAGVPGNRTGDDNRVARKRLLAHRSGVFVHAHTGRRPPIDDVAVPVDCEPFDDRIGNYGADTVDARQCIAGCTGNLVQVMELARERLRRRGSDMPDRKRHKHSPQRL
mgnify:CR=1 FL=1